MQDQPLLTQAERDFIQQLHQPSQPPRQPTTNLQVDAAEQFKALLANCAANQQLTIEAHFANQRLTFTARLSLDDQHEQHLELGTPRIFDEGPASRAWRLPLEPAVALRQADGAASELWVHELSMNGLLLDYRGKARPPRRFNLALPLGGAKPVAIEGTLVRRTGAGLLAYRLEALDRRGSQRLLQFIYEQHRLRYPEAHRA